MLALLSWAMWWAPKTLKVFAQVLPLLPVSREATASPCSQRTSMTNKRDRAAPKRITRCPTETEVRLVAQQTQPRPTSNQCRSSYSSKWLNTTPVAKASKKRKVKKAKNLLISLNNNFKTAKSATNSTQTNKARKKLLKNKFIISNSNWLQIG